MQIEAPGGSVTRRTPITGVAGRRGLLQIPTTTATEARIKLDRLLDEVAATHEPILSTGNRTNAVLLSEMDWRAVEETLYLLSIPEMRESIIEELNTPLEKTWPALEVFP